VPQAAGICAISSPARAGSWPVCRHWQSRPHRPDRNSPRKSKKVGDFPARKPGEPTVTNVTRYIQFHLFEPWMIT
jgi:hypothetical protein